RRPHVDHDLRVRPHELDGAGPQPARGAVGTDRYLDAVPRRPAAPAFGHRLGREDGRQAVAIRPREALQHPAAWVPVDRSASVQYGGVRAGNTARRVDRAWIAVAHCPWLRRWSATMDGRVEGRAAAREGDRGC